MPTLTLALVIHNHQPVGNFEHVFAGATEKAYSPLLAALARHPAIRISLPCSGPLLDWLDANRPDQLMLLGDLVSREQVELLTGGYYEPILISVPDADKHGQARKMTDFLTERFGHRATSAWVSERVWDLHLPKPLAQAGVEHTLFDDTPFTVAGLTAGDLYCPYITEEMMHWALPPDAFVSFADLNRELQYGEEEGDGRSFFTGGSWRCCIARYDKMNQMHKKMPWVSRKLHAMPEGEDEREALDHVWSAQYNCGCWHGVFGGICLFRIRATNFARLIAAENLADRTARRASPGTNGWANVKRVDFAADGCDEIPVNPDRQVLILKPSQGGALVEGDWRHRNCSRLNTMERHREGHHEMLRRAAERDCLILPGEQENSKSVRVKEPDVQTRLLNDRHRRVALLYHSLYPHATPEAFSQAGYEELGTFVDQPYRTETRVADDSIQVTLSRDGVGRGGDLCFPVRVEKTIRVRAGSHAFSTTYRLTNLEHLPVKLRFGVEFNWGIVASDGPQGYLEVGSRSTRLDGLVGPDKVSRMTVGSTGTGFAGEVRLNVARPPSLCGDRLELRSWLRADPPGHLYTTLVGCVAGTRTCLENGAHPPAESARTAAAVTRSVLVTRRRRCVLTSR